MNFSSWTSKERLISGAFFALSLGSLSYGLKQSIAPLSAEFFSMLAVITLLIGLALNPSVMLKPLQESLGEKMQSSLRIALGLFCGFQLAAVVRLLMA